MAIQSFDMIIVVIYVYMFGFSITKLIYLLQNDLLNIIYFLS